MNTVPNLQIQECGCDKKVSAEANWLGVQRKQDILEKTTCSKEATVLRGFHQKVISYSIFSK